MAKPSTVVETDLEFLSEGLTQKVVYQTLTVKQYLSMVLKDPKLVRRAPRRMYDMIMSHGTGTYKKFHEVYQTYKFFADPVDNGKDAVFGLEIPLHEFMKTLGAAARNMAATRRIILLHGPVGSAKSTVARLLKKGCEAYSKTEDGKMYTFKWVRSNEFPTDFFDALYGKGVQEVPAPMNHDPVYLIDPEKREAFVQKMRELHPNGGNDVIVLKGDLDPSSRLIYRQLLDASKGDWETVMRHVVVTRLVLSEKDRVGIGTFQPKDEKNQDATELTGHLNYRKIAIYGSESDPRAFNFDGEFNIANRGIIEFVELLKLDTAFLYDLLTASEEGKIKPKRFAQVDIDELIIGHTNEPELKKLESNEYMEALRNRTIPLVFPYTLRLSEEMRIYNRDLAGQPIHIAPHTIEVASLFSVGSRLKAAQGDSPSLIQKVRLYDGSHVTGFSEENVRELMKQGDGEGVDFGISPRTIQDVMDNILVEHADRGCVHPFIFLRAAERAIAGLPVKKDVKEGYQKLRALVEGEFELIIKRDVQTAISADTKQAQVVFEKYIQNVMAASQNEKIINPVTQREEDPDEKFMMALEAEADIRSASKADFRRSFIGWYAAQQSKGKTPDWRSHEQLRLGIEKYLFSQQKDSIQLANLVTHGASTETQAKIDIVKQRMIQNQGYCPICADDMLSYVASVFAKGGTGTSK